MTATTENTAPFGFQHLVHPQAWLYAIWPPIDTLTGFFSQRQVNVPPAKLAEPCLMPLSMDGWSRIFSAIDTSLSTFPGYALDDVAHSHFDQLLPVHYRWPIRTSHVELRLPVDRELLGPLTLDDDAIFLPDTERELDQLLRRLVEREVPAHEHISDALPGRHGTNKQKVDDAIAIRINVLVIERER